MVASTSLEGHSAQMVCADWNPQGDRIATGARDGTVRIWAARTGDELLSLRPFEHARRGGTSPRRCAWSPDGRQLAIASGYSLKIFEAPGFPGVDE